MKAGWTLAGLFLLLVYIVFGWTLAVGFLKVHEQAAMGRRCVERNAEAWALQRSLANSVLSVAHDPHMVNTVGALRLLANSPASPVLTVTRKEEGAIE